jgi:hypothetical protein
MRAGFGHSPNAAGAQRPLADSAQPKQTTHARRPRMRAGFGHSPDAVGAQRPLADSAQPKQTTHARRPRMRELALLPAPRRVPPRRSGNFYLLVQIKVTKTNDLNTSRCELLAAATHLLPRLRHENNHLATASVISLRFSRLLSIRLDPRGSSPRCAVSGVESPRFPLAVGEERRVGRDQKGRCLRGRTRARVQPLPRPTRAPQRTPRSGAMASGRLSLLTFFGEAKKVRRPSGRLPDAVQRVAAIIASRCVFVGGKALPPPRWVQRVAAIAKRCEVTA